jgi:hypothetical protein
LGSYASAPNGLLLQEDLRKMFSPTGKPELNHAQAAISPGSLWGSADGLNGAKRLVFLVK